MRQQDRLRLASGMILFGLFVLWGFGYETVWRRLTLSVDGTVTRRFDMPAAGAARRATQYTLSAPGQPDRSYVAGATDASLPRNLPVGTHVVKRKWHLGYELNGKWFGFPIGFYAPILAGAFIAVTAGMFLYRRQPGPARV